MAVASARQGPCHCWLSVSLSVNMNRVGVAVICAGGGGLCDIHFRICRRNISCTRVWCYRQYATGDMIWTWLHISVVIISPNLWWAFYVKKRNKPTVNELKGGIAPPCPYTWTFWSSWIKLLRSAICIYQGLFFKSTRGSWKKKNLMDSHPYSHERSIFTLGAPHEEVQGRQTKLHPGISILRDSHIVLSKRSYWCPPELSHRAVDIL